MSINGFRGGIPSPVEENEQGQPVTVPVLPQSAFSSTPGFLTKAESVERKASAPADRALPHLDSIEDITRYVRELERELFEIKQGKSPLFTANPAVIPAEKDAPAFRQKVADIPPVPAPVENVVLPVADETGKVDQQGIVPPSFALPQRGATPLPAHPDNIFSGFSIGFAGTEERGEPTAEEQPELSVPLFPDPVIAAEPIPSLSHDPAIQDPQEDSLESILAALSRPAPVRESRGEPVQEAPLFDPSAVAAADAEFAHPAPATEAMPLSVPLTLETTREREAVAPSFDVVGQQTEEALLPTEGGAIETAKTPAPSESPTSHRLETDRFFDSFFFDENPVSAPAAATMRKETPEETATDNLDFPVMPTITPAEPAATVTSFFSADAWKDTGFLDASASLLEAASPISEEPSLPQEDAFAAQAVPLVSEEQRQIESHWTEEMLGSGFYLSSVGTLPASDRETTTPAETAPQTEASVDDFAVAETKLLAAEIFSQARPPYTENNRLSSREEDYLVFASVTSNYSMRFQNAVTRPLFEQLDVAVKKGSCTAFLSDSPLDINALLRAIKNKSGLKSGQIVVGGQPSESSRSLLYVENDGMVKQGMSVLQFLMFCLSAVKDEPNTKQEQLLSVLEDVGIDHLAMTDTKYLTQMQRIAVLLVAAAMSSLIDGIVINPAKMPQELADEYLLRQVFLLLHRMGKTVLLSGTNVQLASVVANRVIALSGGKLVFDGDVVDFVESEAELAAHIYLTEHPFFAEISRLIPQAALYPSSEGLTILVQSEEQLVLLIDTALERGIPARDIRVARRSFLRAAERLATK